MFLFDFSGGIVAIDPPSFLVTVLSFQFGLSAGFVIELAAVLVNLFLAICVTGGS
jgi:hypothetical protein